MADLWLFESARLRPDSASIVIAETTDCDRAHATAQIILARLHRNRPVDRAGRGGRAIGRDRWPCLRPGFQFWRSAAAAAAAQQWRVRWRRVRRRWRLVRRRPVRAI